MDDGEGPQLVDVIISHRFDHDPGTVDEPDGRRRTDAETLSALNCTSLKNKLKFISTLQTLSGQYDILKRLKLGKRRSEWKEAVAERTQLNRALQRERQQQQQVQPPRPVLPRTPESKEASQKCYLEFLRMYVNMASQPGRPADPEPYVLPAAAGREYLTNVELNGCTATGTAQWSVSYFSSTYRMIQELMIRDREDYPGYEWKNIMPTNVVNNLDAFLIEIKKVLLDLVKPVDATDEAIVDIDDARLKKKTGEKDKEHVTLPFLGVPYRTRGDGYYLKDLENRPIQLTAEEKREWNQMVSDATFRTIWDTIKSGFKAWKKLFKNLETAAAGRGKLASATAAELSGFGAAGFYGQED
jgi:hypothetical protein